MPVPSPTSSTTPSRRPCSSPRASDSWTTATTGASWSRPDSTSVAGSGRAPGPSPRATSPCSTPSWTGCPSVAMPWDDREPSGGTFPRHPGLTLREETSVETQTLLGRLREADPRAFEAFVVAYQHRVFGIALRMMRDPAEAEDVAQEVFLRAHRGL